MRQTYTPCVILAFNTNDETLETNLIKSLGISAFKQLIGCYKGETKDSYLVPFNGPHQLQGLIRLASQYGQESILLRDSENNASLFYIETGDTEHLGQLRSVSKATAMQQDAWTYDFTDDAYYIVA